MRNNEPWDSFKGKHRATIGPPSPSPGGMVRVIPTHSLPIAPFPQKGTASQVGATACVVLVPKERTCFQAAGGGGMAPPRPFSLSHEKGAPPSNWNLTNPPSMEADSVLKAYFPLGAHFSEEILCLRAGRRCQHLTWRHGEALDAGNHLLHLGACGKTMVFLSPAKKILASN